MKTVKNVVIVLADGFEEVEAIAPADVLKRLGCNVILAGLKNMLFGRRFFREKLAEYASASHRGKKNIYLNFAVDITAGCDCEPRKMSSCTPDIGVFASLDPVAIDAACLDAAAKAGKVFKGRDILEYAASLGTGNRSYEIIEV